MKPDTECEKVLLYFKDGLSLFGPFECHNTINQFMKLYRLAKKRNRSIEELLLKFCVKDMWEGINTQEKEETFYGQKNQTKMGP